MEKILNIQKREKFEVGELKQRILDNERIGKNRLFSLRIFFISTENMLFLLLIMIFKKHTCKISRYIKRTLGYQWTFEIFKHRLLRQ